MRRVLRWSLRLQGMSLSGVYINVRAYVSGRATAGYALISPREWRARKGEWKYATTGIIRGVHARGFVYGTSSSEWAYA